jgi:hypothetical protein
MEQKKPPDKNDRETKPIRKRPDRAEKFQKRKTMKETVIKMSLMGSLVFQQKYKKEKFLDAIENRVYAASQRTHLASVGLNYLVKKLFHEKNINEVDIPEFWNETFIRQFMLGTESAQKPFNCISQVHQERPELLYDMEDRHLGDRNIYSNQAKKYATNMKNHLKMNLAGNIKRYIYTVPKQDGSLKFSKNEAISMLFAVNGWKSKKKALEPLTPEMLFHVNTVRNILGLEQDQVIDKVYMKATKNLFNMVRFSVFVNQAIERIIPIYEEENKTRDDKNKLRVPKLTNIFPISTLKRHFITLDTSDLIGILNENNLLHKSLMEKSDEMWKSVFNYNKYKKKEFTFTIDTDGVAVNFHYLHEKEVSHKEDEDDSPIPKRYPQNARFVGIDPGRTNILYIVEIKKDGTKKVYKLTRNQYYAEAGINIANKNSATWNKHVEDKIRVLSENSPKGSSLPKFIDYMNARMSVSGALFDEYFRRCWAQQRFRLYGGKKRVFSRFLNKLKPHGDEPVVAFYGSAKFAPGGKGEVSVPTSRAYKEVSSRMITIPTSEFRTTSIDYETLQILKGVGEHNLGNEVVSVRGLLWCDSTKPEKAGKFINRDMNAALNILKCGKGPRPAIMDRSKCTEALPEKRIFKILKTHAASLRKREVRRKQKAQKSTSSVRIRSKRVSDDPNSPSRRQGLDRNIHDEVLKKKVCPLLFRM